MEMRIRPALIEDAERLGALHVASWREAYAGILPDEILSALSVEDRVAMWSMIIGEAPEVAGSAVWVAEEDGGLAGLGSCGLQRDRGLREQGFDAEIFAIYILKSHQGLGLGRGLMAVMASFLLDRGHRTAALWVLRENAAARAFYEHLGGEPVAEQVEMRPEAALVELAYGWRDLAGLMT
jgi:GNAT superfamily N-acetyltransferase